MISLAVRRARYLLRIRYWRKFDLEVADKKVSEQMEVASVPTYASVLKNGLK